MSGLMTEDIVRAGFVEIEEALFLLPIHDFSEELISTLSMPGS